MSNKIYVGNMSYSTTEEELRELFEGYGAVKTVNIIIDRDTGRSKGFGFVEMENEDEARAAISSLNSRELGGRQLRISEANERPERPRRDNRDYRY